MALSIVRIWVSSKHVLGATLPVCLVRSLTPFGLSLYNKKLNKQWESDGNAATPLGLIHDVDFEIIDTQYMLEPHYMEMMQKGQLKKDDLNQIVATQNNVVKQINIKWQVRKEG